MSSKQKKVDQAKTAGKLPQRQTNFKGRSLASPSQNTTTTFIRSHSTKSRNTESSHGIHAERDVAKMRSEAFMEMLMRHIVEAMENEDYNEVLRLTRTGLIRAREYTAKDMDIDGKMKVVARLEFYVGKAYLGKGDRNSGRRFLETSYEMSKNSDDEALRKMIRDELMSLEREEMKRRSKSPLNLGEKSTGGGGGSTVDDIEIHVSEQTIAGDNTTSAAEAHRIPIPIDDDDSFMPSSFASDDSDTPSFSQTTHFDPRSRADSDENFWALREEDAMNMRRRRKSLGKSEKKSAESGTTTEQAKRKRTSSKNNGEKGNNKTSSSNKGKRRRSRQKAK